jgi:hypothetical protein
MMENLPLDILVSVPAAIAVIYVVRLFLISQREWRTDLKDVVKISNDVIERNTTALLKEAIKISNEIIERNTAVLIKLESIIVELRKNRQRG